MVFRREHMNCNEYECTELTAYVRIEGKMTRIGYYGSECKQFEPLNLQREEEDKKLKQRMDFIKSEIKQAKQENKERLRIIQNEFNQSVSFFKEQTRSYQSDSK